MKHQELDKVAIARYIANIKVVAEFVAARDLT